MALNRGPLVEGFGTPAPLTPHEVEAAVAAGAVVVDGRTNEQFDEAHVAGALSTSAYDTGFATKVSRVAPAGAEVIVVAASDGDELRRRRAARRGGPAGAGASSGRDDRVAHRGAARAEGSS